MLATSLSNMVDRRSIFPGIRRPALSPTMQPASCAPPAQPRCPSRAQMQVCAAQKVSDLPASLRKIVGAFQMVPDPMARYKQLLYYANKLERLPAEDHIPVNKVEGCVSQVWVKAELKPDGLIQWRADSDSQLTKGLAALLVLGLSGCSPSEILKIEPEFIEMLGLKQSLTPSRNNGFLNMFKLMQRRCLDLLGATAGATVTSATAVADPEAASGAGKPVSEVTQMSAGGGANSPSSSATATTTLERPSSTAASPAVAPTTSTSASVPGSSNSSSTEGSSSNGHSSTSTNNGASSSNGHGGSKPTSKSLDGSSSHVSVGMDSTDCATATAAAAKAARAATATTSTSRAPIQDGIRSKLTEAFSPSRLVILDQSADHAGHAAMRSVDGKAGSGETHFRVEVVSDAFEGLSLVKRQRQIYSLLTEEFARGLHALSLDTRTPAEAAARVQ